MNIETNHKIIADNSSDMSKVKDNSVDLIVTSPPYPMIEMWDSLFSSINKEIKNKLEQCNGKRAFELMHEELNKTWLEVTRILKPGGIACINIGDATRKIDDLFQLYSNHSKIINFFIENGFVVLPDILWRKQSNKPNKFMGSGMLPTNAYVTLEHEYVLILRKGKNRNFSGSEKELRYHSAFFWEERNIWFSDVWFDLKGTTQKLNHNELRNRSAAYPYELAYRLINMYSLQGDTILDPFWGTGTTTLAAMSSARNSIGYELDNNFIKLFNKDLEKISLITSEKNNIRLNQHLKFIRQREEQNRPMKHISSNYDFGVITSQEKDIIFYDIDKINFEKHNHYIASHKKHKHKMQQRIDSYSTSS